MPELIQVGEYKVNPLCKLPSPERLEIFKAIKKCPEAVLTPERVRAVFESISNGKDSKIMSVLDFEELPQGTGVLISLPNEPFPFFTTLKQLDSVRKTIQV